MVRMKRFVLVALAAVWGLAMGSVGPALAECPADSNSAQLAWCEAREKVLALEENSVEQAKAWEALAQSDAAVNQATQLGLGGQKNGKPNYAPAVARSWNNAGYAYYLNGQYEDAIRCLQKALADPGLDTECKRWATGTLDAADAGKAKADRKAQRAAAGK